MLRLNSGDLTCSEMLAKSDWQLYHTDVWLLIKLLLNIKPAAVCTVLHAYISDTHQLMIPYALPRVVVQCELGLEDTARLHPRSATYTLQC